MWTPPPPPPLPHSPPPILPSLSSDPPPSSSLTLPKLPSFLAAFPIGKGLPIPGIELRISGPKANILPLHQGWKWNSHLLFSLWIYSSLSFVAASWQMFFCSSLILYLCTSSALGESIASLLNIGLVLPKLSHIMLKKVPFLLSVY